MLLEFCRWWEEFEGQPPETRLVQGLEAFIKWVNDFGPLYLRQLSEASLSSEVVARDEKIYDLTRQLQVSRSWASHLAGQLLTLEVDARRKEKKVTHLTELLGEIQTEFQQLADGMKTWGSIR